MQIADCVNGSFNIRTRQGGCEQLRASTTADNFAYGGTWLPNTLTWPMAYDAPPGRYRATTRALRCLWHE
eukprot:5789999-Prymnesium_polylepis.1